MTGPSALALAEAVRAHPRGVRLLLDDRAARDMALRHDGTVQARFGIWLHELEIAPRLQDGIAATWRRLRVSFALLMLLAVLAGMAAAGTALAGEGTVNILWALVGLVGVPLLLLLSWLLLTALSLTQAPAGRTSVVGHLLMALVSGIAKLSGAEARDPDDRRAAVRAALSVLSSGGSGRWMFASTTHGFWLAFAVAAWLACALRMSFVQYDFVWETTLLGDGTAQAILAMIAWLPQVLGLAAPDAALLEASRAGGVPAGREVWGRFLLACLLVYGVLPRLALAALSAVLLQRAWRRREPDLADPVFLPAVMELQRASKSQAPQGPQAPADVPMSPVAPATRFGAGRYLALTAIELEHPELWPPVLVEGAGLDLGHVNTRKAAQQLLADLRDLPARPRFVLVACSMLRVPDRGSADLLAAIARAAEVPVLLVLVEAEAAVARAIDAERRVEDWRSRADAAGVGGCTVMALGELAGRSLDSLTRLLPLRAGALT